MTLVIHFIFVTYELNVPWAHMLYMCEYIRESLRFVHILNVVFVSSSYCHIGIIYYNKIFFFFFLQCKTQSNINTATENNQNRSTCDEWRVYYDQYCHWYAVGR